MRIALRRTLSGRILDVGGGGEGVIGRLYGAQVVAIDNCPEELAEAPDSFEKRVMDARKLDFPDLSFDAVTFFYSLLFMNAETQAQALREAYRVLRPGGCLCVWDAEFARAYPEPFCAELELDLDGTQLRTAYGVVSDVTGQSAASVAALCRSAGSFVRSSSEVSHGHFYLEFVK